MHSGQSGYLGFNIIIGRYSLGKQ